MDELTGLADILFQLLYHSRRSAKRLMREAGGHGSDDELNAIAAVIISHPQREQIERLAREKHEAEQLVLTLRLSRKTDVEPTPAWLFAESHDGARTFLVHTCPGGAWSFVGEIFDEGADAPVDDERYELTKGQWLSNVLWLDERPANPDRLALMEAARREFARYDANHGLKGDDPL